MTQTQRSGAPRQENAALETTPTQPEGSTGRPSAGVDPEAVRTWAKGFIDQVDGTVPLAGSPEWIALSDRDRRKWASVLYAGMWHCDEYNAEAAFERAEIAEYLDRTAEKQAAVVLSAMWLDRGRVCTCVDANGAPLLGACPRLKQDPRHGYRHDFPTFAALRARRTDYSTGRTVDPEAVARWVATGSSEPASAAPGQEERSTAA